MQCPDCQSPLKTNASRCGCGWSLHGGRNAPPVSVDCAHMGCGYHAMAKIQTKTGLASLCSVHYAKHFQDIAEEKCVELGLLTPSMCRDWVRANAGRIFKRAA
jgi:hypothetical protein